MSALPPDAGPGPTPHRGVAGVAHEIPIPDVPKAAETCCSWLIDAPGYHPFWSQYNLVVVRLRDGVPGFPEPKRQFPGATHELLILAINLEHGVWTIDRAVAAYRAGSGLPFLQPVNLALQFEGTDREMRLCADLACRAIVNGAMSPEAALPGRAFREGWLASLVKTLAHIRGEEHAP